MPSTLGLRDAQAVKGNARYWSLVGDLRTAAGDLTLPAGLLSQAGLAADAELICEAGPNGLRLTADRLRKVYVEVTSACNLACVTCIRHSWDEPLGHMPLARFRRLVQGLPAGGDTPTWPVTLSLSGFGEPLAHPDFLTLVALAREDGLRLEIITNGTLLDASLAAQLAALGVAQVAVSLDGGDDAAYGCIRDRDLGAAVGAVKALLDARRRARSAMTIGAAFVATRRNIAGLPQLLQLARDLDLDFVSVSNVVPHTAEMAAEMLWGRAAWASSFPPAGWRPRLALAHLDLDGDTRPAVAAIIERAPLFPPPNLDDGARLNHCRFVHEGMLAVSWDGRVAPCLSLLHTHPEHVNGHWKTVRSFAIGHVDERPLADIWRDGASRDFRARVRSFDFAPCFACGGCPETDTNDTDCYGSPFPSCSECLWAQGIVLCP